MSRIRTVSAKDKLAALDAAIQILQRWKKMPEVKTIDVKLDRGVDEVISSDQFRRFEKNGTYTLRVLVNGGARGI